MKKVRSAAIWTAILSCLLIFAFAEDVEKAVQGTVSDARIIYNGKEAELGIKPVLIEGSNYLSVRVVSSLFDKNIYWDQNKNEILISDKTNPQSEYLASELAVKNKSIEELEAKVKKLEKDLQSGKKPSIEELQEKINDEYGGYEGVSYRVILSGNEDEIRVRIEIDLSRDKSSWNRLSTDGKDELIEEITSVIAEEYASAKIKGYFKDISASKKMNPFYYDWKSELVKGNYANYSTISIIEEKMNSEYEDYFPGIHLTFTLNGNDSIAECTAYIQKDRFEEKWDALPDNSVKNLMRKLCNDINKEFKECYIYGYIYDTDSNEELAFCEQTVEGDFVFGRED
ncbi:MAG: stalk domain-containing protein [Clostridiaceae bacterium]|nr:stalk domain-containing protein [Clostridiaceae bacterium]